MPCVEACLRYLTSFCNLHAPASPRIMAKATEPDNYRPGLVEWSTTKIIISFRIGQGVIQNQLSKLQADTHGQYDVNTKPDACKYRPRSAADYVADESFLKLLLD